MIDKELIEHIRRSIVEKAKNREAMATFSGAGHDGGAKRMLSEFDIWMAGINNTIPPIYEAYVEQFNKMQDPDYEMYLELKKKFHS